MQARKQASSWSAFSRSHALEGLVEVTLDQVVTVTESRYPKMSFTKLLSDIGGSLGIWLGMGIIQLCVILVNLVFSKLRKPIWNYVF